MENSPLAPRNRRRREREPPRRGHVEEHEKPSSKAQEKQLTRTPLRYVPDAAGFETLSKPEIKSDMREIEKNITMMPTHSQDIEGNDGLIICSSKPPCPPESNIAKKRKRYVTWINHPELIEQDMAKYKAALTQIQNEYKDIVDDEMRWTDAFHVGRRHLLAQNNLLDDEMKSLRDQGQQLYSLCVEEAGIQSRKRRTMHMRDVFNELHDRNQDLMAQIAEHKKLVSDLEGVPNLSWLAMPLQCEVGVEALGFAPRQAVSTPYGKGVVVAIKDRRSQQAGVVVVVKLDIGVAYLQHHQVQTLDKWATKVGPAVHDQASMDIPSQRLLSRFSSVEERLRLAEASVGDIENFLPDDDEDEEDGGENSDGLEDQPIAARHREEQAQAALYLMHGPNHDDSFWLHQLEERTTKQQPRRKRRGTTAIECHSTLLPRAPYQVPLLLSPVSQFPDRYLAGLYGGDPTELRTADHMPVPDQLLHAENIALGNQRLLGNLARAKILLKRLEDARDDWQKQLEESDKTCVRTRGIFQTLEAESEMLYAQHRRDLAAWQISKGAAAHVDEADLLLAAQADAQQKNARGVARGNGRAKRGGRGRGSLKGDPLSLSQESVGSVGPDVDLDQERSLDKDATLDSEALAIGALASLGAVHPEEDAEDDADKKGAKKRVVRRRNR